MGPTYTITLDTGFLLDLSKAITAQTMPLVHQTVKAVTFQTAENWKAAVYKAKLWSGEKDAYANSIKAEMVGDFSGLVTADYKHAAAIETGRPPRDLKEMLNTSLKVRRTLDGRRFLVIPFRHNTPGNTAHASDMPDHVYEQAKLLKASTIVRETKRLSGEVTRISPAYGMQRARSQPRFLSDIGTRKAALVNQNVYAWGQRLLPGNMGPNPKGKVDRFAGMVRFDTSSGKQKSSSFMTFRVMVEGSKGWVVPAQPGQFIARNVARDMQPKAEDAFQAAMKATRGG
jgi:hypothetical protein